MTTETDDELIARATEADGEALAAILERHLHPAWRVALAATASAAAAEEAVITGVCDALNAASRNPDPTISLRTRIAACVQTAASALDADRSRPQPTHDDPILAAFASLPAASRTALWLTEVEGGDAAQVAPVLRVDRGVAGALANRAAATLRDRLAADAAANATNPTCARVLGKLPAHAAGKLTADERGRMGEHLASCGSCAATLASLVAPRPALRRLVVPVPATLPGAVAERWAETGGRDRVAARRWSERTIGAAAAGILAIGLGGAVLLGRGGGSPDVTEFASPAPIDLSSLAEDDATATSLPLPSPVLPAAPTRQTVRVESTSGSRSPGGGGGGTDSTGERPRGSDPSTTTSTPSTTSTTQPPTTTTTPTTEQPSGSDGGSSTPPATDDGSTTVELPGGTTVEVGDTTSTDQPLLEVTVPGLDPVTIPNVLGSLTG